VAPLHYWIDQGGSGRFIIPAEYFESLRAGFHASDEEAQREAARLIRDAHGTGLLVLDDFGAERPSPWVAEQTYLTLNSRMNEERPTVITSNFTPEQAVERLAPGHSAEDRVTADRLTSRLRKLCTVVHLAGGRDLRGSR
jgi:DNA replication protein DnaC